MFAAQDHQPAVAPREAFPSVASLSGYRERRRERDDQWVADHVVAESSTIGTRITAALLLTYLAGVVGGVVMGVAALLS